MKSPRYLLVIVEATPDELDVAIGRLTLLGADGIEERDATTLVRGGARGVTLVASFATSEAADEAVAAFAPNARLEVLEGDAWRDAWKQHWKPTRLGASLVVVPSWLEYAPQAGERVLRLDPGRAFGTGQHASTALVVEWLDRLPLERATPVLDVGCGSGILSFAALTLGASVSVGCDVDPDAVASADENARSLGLNDRATFVVGGVEALPSKAAVVLANIEASVLVPLASALAARVLPGGALVLSGILDGQLTAITEAYTAQGLTSAGALSREGWVAPRFDRKAWRVLPAVCDRTLGDARGGDVRILEPAQAHHLAHVLRCAVGDEVRVFDGRGTETRARIERVEPGRKGRVVVRLLADPLPGTAYDAASVCWLQGLPKGDKMEDIVRAATELGVRCVVPVITSRSVARPRDPHAKGRKLRDVADAASAQCGRADVPEILDPIPLDEALRQVPDWARLRLVAWEESRTSLAGVLSPAKDGGCAVLVGPEGGLDAVEVGQAEAVGFRQVSLGPRILRTETVAPAVLGMLSLARGDLGRR